ncbi:SulP family inorganic anion transporter [Paracoccus ravus]|uniref:SulP family inorganic anion transporter n=1 Tax=Paracoccus ravus TaxID=2447760 RepID=UPI00106E2C66|nr:SulP family inorganic anion transporter [Paracoccus ravus]
MNKIVTSSRELRPGLLLSYTPKLLSVLREGYDARDLRADAVAGMTVAIVALPLSMAIAIASGATPTQGLYTSIFGGFLVSALGGSRFQIGGPAGAFIVLVAATVAQHGIEGLILATCLSGMMLTLVGMLRLGSFVQFVPFPVTVGFTAGIAVIIFVSQIKDLLGLSLPHEPGELIGRLLALWSARDSFTPAAFGLALVTIVLILTLRRLRPHWPGMLIAIILASLAAACLALPVETIGSRFGGIPSALPRPALPDLSVQKVVEVFPAALAFTLLGAIESLLSAVVADGMTGRRHRPNCELVAQGLANIGSALFGGFCVTGTVARTATNVRAGAHGPVSGMLHAVFLLLFVLIAAPLAAYIPLAALAGVLAVVAWNMIDRAAIGILARSGLGEGVVLTSTFLLTIFRDLIEAIVVGIALGSVIFIQRIVRTTSVESGAASASAPSPLEQGTVPAGDLDILIYRINGPIFFGAAGSISSVLERIHESQSALILDLAGVPVLDATGANMIADLARKARRQGVSLWVAGANPALRRGLLLHGLRPPLCRHASSVEKAIARQRAANAAAPKVDRG